MVSVLKSGALDPVYVFTSLGLLTRLVMMSTLNNKTALFPSITSYQIRVLWLLSGPNLHFLIFLQSIISSKIAIPKCCLMSVRNLLENCSAGSRRAALLVLMKILAWQRWEDGRLIST